MRTSVPEAIRRYAMSLTDMAQRGNLHRLLDAIEYDAQTNPRKSVDLIVALAELSARNNKSPGSEDLATFLRAAHAAYNRGERFNWVIDGEREYQRNKARRSRARAQGKEGDAA